MTVLDKMSFNKSIVLKDKYFCVKTLGFTQKRKLL